MKLMKKKYSFILIIFVIISFSINVYASNIDDIYNSNSFNNSQEKNEIKNYLNNSFDSIKGGLYLNNLNNKDTDIILDEEITKNKDTAFRVYYLTNFNNEYNVKSLEGLISQKYEWQLPIYNSENEIISTVTFTKGESLDEVKKYNSDLSDEMEEEIKKFEGKWYITLIGNSMSLEAIEIVSDKNKMTKFLDEKNIKDPTDIKIIAMPVPYIYVIYVKDSTGGEYVIPFSKRIDCPSLLNGEVYKISELFTLLEETYSCEYEEGLYGGVPNIKLDSKSKNNNIIYIICISASILLVLMFLFYKKRKYNCENAN